MFHSRVKRALLAGALAGAALLAGCSGQPEFNDQDVTFATDMIGHHRQAIEMAGLASERQAGPEVAALAKRIEEAQQPEIDTMAGWLEDWGKPVPAENPMEHGGHAMPGMMSGDQLEDLGKASGRAFDRLFLEMMIEHHEGAIEMAEKERASGANPDAKALADRVIADQTAEIAEMRKLLD
jgi:uncharacterized protein (DUF305 family)